MHKEWCSVGSAAAHSWQPDLRSLPAPWKEPSEGIAGVSALASKGIRGSSSASSLTAFLGLPPSVRCTPGRQSYRQTLLVKFESHAGAWVVQTPQLTDKGEPWNAPLTGHTNLLGCCSHSIGFISCSMCTSLLSSEHSYKTSLEG